MALYPNAMRISKSYSLDKDMCADPTTSSAGSCCVLNQTLESPNDFDVAGLCRFEAERMSYATAKARCAEGGSPWPHNGNGFICPLRRPNGNNGYGVFTNANNPNLSTDPHDCNYHDPHYMRAPLPPPPAATS